MTESMANDPTDPIPIIPPTSPSPKDTPPLWKQLIPTRDKMIFGTGLALTVNEIAFQSGPERPYILILLSGMMGLPVFLNQDAKKNGDKGGKGGAAA